MHITIFFRRDRAINRTPTRTDKCSWKRLAACVMHFLVVEDDLHHVPHPSSRSGSDSES